MDVEASEQKKKKEEKEESDCEGEWAYATDKDGNTRKINAPGW
jgi:hypothetical protein